MMVADEARMDCSVAVREIVGIMQGKGFEALYGYSPPIQIPYTQGTKINSEVELVLGDVDAVLQPLLCVHSCRVQNSRQVHITVFKKEQLKILTHSYD